MSELSNNEIKALTEALDDEYQAWSIYDQVIADFGEVMPFINIRDSEGRHIEALTSLFHRYALPVPHNTWPGRVPRFSSVREACEAAVTAEIANADLYARLISATHHLDILTVFQRLQEASQQRHLVAFRRCANREERDEGCGPRRRRRRQTHRSSHHT